MNKNSTFSSDSEKNPLKKVRSEILYVASNGFLILWADGKCINMQLTVFPNIKVTDVHGSTTDAIDIAVRSKKADILFSILLTELKTTNTSFEQTLLSYILDQSIICLELSKNCHKVLWYKKRCYVTNLPKENLHQVLQPDSQYVCFLPIYFWTTYLLSFRTTWLLTSFNISSRRS